MTNQWPLAIDFRSFPSISGKFDSNWQILPARESLTSEREAPMLPRITSSGGAIHTGSRKVRDQLLAPRVFAARPSPEIRPMQNVPKPQSKSTDPERDRLRQELLRRIVKNETERRAGPQTKS
jgi:hypothetical protein